MAPVSEITIVRSEERHPGNLQRELYVVRRIRDEMKLDGDETSLAVAAVLLGCQQETLSFRFPMS
jgi:hypothetical protein